MVIKLAEMKCTKLVGKKLRIIPPVLLKLLLKVCVNVANVVCLKHTLHDSHSSIIALYSTQAEK